MNKNNTKPIRKIAYNLLEGTIKFFFIVYISTSSKFLINKESRKEESLNILLNKIDEETKDFMKILNRNLEIKSDLLAEILSKNINEKEKI